MNGKMYWDILDKKSAAIYQDDEDETTVNISARKWTAKLTQLVSEKENKLLEWSSQSPDLNPIQTPLGYFKEKGRATQPLKERADDK